MKQINLDNLQDIPSNEVKQYIINLQNEIRNSEIIAYRNKQNKQAEIIPEKLDFTPEERKVITNLENKYRLNFENSLKQANIEYKKIFCFVL